ncbi:hypothetical protein [Deinococcus pimensis]|uniref:hypothetical protein n=1 Tax=Deinococcus pimensis TaxID=309888 RepID=UPI0004B9B7DD|nr:hypothetical protein [Deinococcus pimensis]
MNPELADTIVAVQGGVARLDRAEAAGNVRGWLGVLEGADFPHAEELRGALSDLVTKLESGDLGDVTDVLARLGNLTMAASSAAPGAVAQDVMALGQALHDAANRPY